MSLARWQATIVDNAGNVQPGASVRVEREAAGLPLANIYSDRDGAVPLGNPFLADSEGFAAFHALGDAYRITATKGGFSRVWRYVAIGNAQEQDGIVAGVRLRFNEDTNDSDPGQGYLKFNSADPASITEIYISDINLLGADISALIDTFDGGGIVSNRGLLTIQASNSDGFFVGQVTGSVTQDGSPSTYRTVTVTPLAFYDDEFTFLQDDLVGIAFNQAGGGLASPVGFSDIQQISSQRILGRATAGSGVIEELTRDGVYGIFGNVIHLALPGVNGLVIANNSGTPTTQIDVDASDAILVNSSGVGIRTGLVDVTINAATTGANGLDAGSLANNTRYYVHIISNGTTTAGLLSLSATAPTMPGGYTFSYRVGMVQTGGSATFLDSLQVGNRVSIVRTTTSGTAAGFLLPPSLTDITIALDETKLSTTDDYLVQLNGETTGYLSGGSTRSGETFNATGFHMRSNAETDPRSGLMFLRRLTGHRWIANHAIAAVDATPRPAGWGAGSKTLSAELSSAQITRTGTNTLDGGQAAIIYHDRVNAT